MSTAKQETIVENAFQILRKEGFHATGVDRLVEKTGISKRTVYRYFRSKEELILAAVVYYETKTFAALTHELEKRGTDPCSKILALFDLREEAGARGDYFGCFATNALLEYDGKHREIEAASKSFLDNLEGLLFQFCSEAEFADPRLVARQIAVILEGTVVLAQCQRDQSVVTGAREIVKLLLTTSQKRKSTEP